MDPVINIAYEATAMYGKHRTGIQVYTENLIREMARRPDQVRIRLFLKRKFFKLNAPKVVDDHIAQRYLHRSFVNVKDCRITHSTDNKFLYKRRCANVATVHDVAIFLRQNDINGFTTPSFAAKQRKVYSEICERSDLVIAGSESAKTDISNVFDLDPNKIRVVYQGVDRPAMPEIERQNNSILRSLAIESKNYLLFVGAISIRKNLLNLLDAFAHSLLSKDIDLVLAGPMSMGADSIKQRVNQLGLADRVVFASYVADADLDVLYKNAVAFVFPTYYEGFGRPVLEAMSFGIPVLIGNRGAAREVTGGLAVEADPFSIDSIEHGLSRVVAAQSMDRRLISHAAKFTWDRCAHEMIDIYKELA